MTRRAAFNHPLPGSPFEPIAVEHAAMIDAAVAHRDSRGATDFANTAAGGRFARMQNVTGADVSFGHALGIGNPVFTAPSGDDFGEFGRHLLLEGDTPAAPEHHGSFGVVMEPVRDGDVCPVAIGGFVLARVNVIDADDRFADIDDTQTVLKSNPNGGAIILAKGSGTGEVWAWLNLDGMLERARTWWAEITGATSTTGNQTIYTVAEVYPRSGSTLAAFTTVSGGRTGSALCVSEASNTSTLAGAVNTAGGSYPAGFSPQRIPNGTVVRIREEIQDDGSVYRVFGHGHTAHDGSCS